jgi:predicted DNA-binding protein (MmcQ/YjbR family)
MDLLELRDYCLSLPLTEETTPFDETTLVYKVAGKMFALTDMVEADRVSLKCAPERALDLREEYADIEAAFHMNKTHWNMVRLDGDLPAEFIKEMIRDSYILVLGGFPKGKRAQLLKLLTDWEEANRVSLP